MWFGPLWSIGCQPEWGQPSTPVAKSVRCGMVGKLPMVKRWISVARSAAKRSSSGVRTGCSARSPRLS